MAAKEHERDKFNTSKVAPKIIEFWPKIFDCLRRGSVIPWTIFDLFGLLGISVDNLRFNNPGTSADPFNPF